MRPFIDIMRTMLVSGVSATALIASAASAQSQPPGNTTGATNAPPSAAAVEDRSGGIDEIIVTAQRQSQSLQDVPIAVSAFTAEALEKQQIDNASDLQLSLPNVTFTKGNFTGSSFTIRGIGDLCVGGTCDSATAIHANDLPLFGTRLFETEYFDLERIEVLRGPQGTLFGRNATSGVVNFITAKPDLKDFHLAAEGEYGNFDSIRGKAMINIPLTETLGVRLAGTYLKRGGYTENLFNGDDLDDREQYAIRGSIRWKPTDNTTIDLLGYYFREEDNRLRIQKQLCQRDPTGVLGCLPGKREYGTTNANSTLIGVFGSRQLFAIAAGAISPGLAPVFAALGLGSLYGPDAYQGNVNPADPRKVSTDYTPTYFTDEIQAQAKIDHDFGPVSLKLSGQYQRNKVDSQQDYNLSVQNRAILQPGINVLAAYAAGLGPNLGIPGLLQSAFAPAAAALIPGGPAGALCASQSEETGTGVFGGHSFCSATPQDFDRSTGRNRAYTGEAILSSHFDGRFNFLLGAIYNDIKSKNIDYYVNAFGLDYIGAVLGGLQTVATRLGQAGAGLPPTYPAVYRASTFFRNNQRDYSLKSYGIFGEAYVDITDRMKLTAGVRYNNDKKRVSARTTLYSDNNGVVNPVTGATVNNNVVVPYGSDSITDALGYASLDFDPTLAGPQEFQNNRVSFSEFTGRAVLDYKLTDENLIYVSYSRGYKSGGVNPPLSPIFAVDTAFKPEFINAFEIGSKNTFLDGTLRLNATAFYYDYKGLQLSRIVARTSVNDNVNAEVYGLEIDSIIEPIRALQFNLGFSYLHTKVKGDKFLANPRDPSGGRSDAVIIKDIQNASNCTVVPTVAGNAVGTNTLVGAINGSLGLQAPTAFPTGSGINGATGAFGICSAVQGAIAAPSAGLRALFATPTGALPFSILAEGVKININGNQLPQAPNFKASAGAQYIFEFGNGMTLIPRYDITFTGTSFGSIFNGAGPGQTRATNRIESYTIQNAQIQLNGKDDKWFVRAFIQNLADAQAITGLYVTDQSSGLFTNVFTLEPRRYGIAGGVRF